ncbi:polynucleotide adenylyltransferase PcnB [Elongatibacter sediminis]|uniref:Poly(A) polymerase I n=1 Tax=Elongatibacter sediminis TaxID=3119006 RepID=A0AAW9REA4_9GAMM
MPEAEHGIPLKELCPHATEVVRELQQAGYQAYIVGGGVRDLLLGKAPKDFDVATDATPEEVHDIFPRCRLIGRRFRLAHVRKRGNLIEVATFRGPHDGEEGNGSANGRILRDNVFGTVEEDAIRRDFTINAMFLDPVSGEIRDYVGGYQDLCERRLRLIGDPETRYREDPVRLLRAARFAAKLGVEPDAESEEPIRRLAVLLEDVPPARLFEEVCKLFLTGHAMRSMESLQRFGLSSTLFPVLPESDKPGGVIIGPLLKAALENTDQRIAEEKPVTPAFLLAALFWLPVKAGTERRMAAGESEHEAILNAAEEVFYAQSRRTSVPKRFTAVAKQIWAIQPRFAKTSGKRWTRIFREPKFRAAYDFLLLRAVEDPALEELGAFWTQAQESRPMEAPAPAPSGPRKRRRRRPRSRNRKRA